MRDEYDHITILRNEGEVWYPMFWERGTCTSYPRYW
jgi:hypothetical protein